MIKVMFVCHGNICRSPMAEFVFRDMVKKRGLSDRIEVASSAVSREEIGSDIHSGTRKILEKYKIPFDKRSAVQITEKDMDEYDYVILMDESNRYLLSRIVGDKAKKARMMLRSRDVADPWYTGNFEKTYKDICEGCEALLEIIGKE